MKKWFYVVPVGTFAAGLVLGMAGSCDQNVEVVPSEKTIAVTTDTTNDSELNRLKLQNQALNDQLKALRNQLNAPKPEEPQVAVNQPPRGEDFQTRMERLREEDPERYDRIQEFRRNFANRVTDSMDMRGDFFAQLDTSKMNERQLKDHQETQERMAKIKGLMEAQAAGEEIDRRELRNEMMQLQGNLVHQRDLAVSQLAESMGYQGEEAQQFSEYISYLYKMTSMESLFGGPRGGR